MPDVPGYTADRVLDALLESLDEGVLIFDDAGICRAAGRRAAELFGLEAAAMVGLTRADLLGRAAAAVEAPDALAPLAAEAIPGERTVVDPIALARPARRTVVCTSVPFGASGRLDLIRDVTRERRAEAASEELSRRLEVETTLDDVTGLSNRKRFEEECQREHRRAQREWISYAVARVDVDGMAGINERLGFDVGSELLKRLGDELKTSRREYDVVARWKDDELVVLLPRVDVRALGTVLRRALDGMHARGRELVPDMSVCVGAALWTPPSGDGPADILRRAGDALVAARRKGKGKVKVDLGSEEWKDDWDAG
jgi:diguanylate cyclase (GGDEF)-like protein